MEINTDKNHKRPADDLMDGWMDGYIILPLRVFEPVACGRMRCLQLWAARFERQKIDTNNQIDRQIDI